MPERGIRSSGRSGWRAACRNLAGACSGGRSGDGQHARGAAPPAGLTLDRGPDCRLAGKGDRPRTSDNSPTVPVCPSTPCVTTKVGHAAAQSSRKPRGVSPPATTTSPACASCGAPGAKVHPRRDPARLLSPCRGGAARTWPVSIPPPRRNWLTWEAKLAELTRIRGLQLVRGLSRGMALDRLSDPGALAHGGLTA